MPTTSRETVIYNEASGEPRRKAPFGSNRARECASRCISQAIISTANAMPPRLTHALSARLPADTTITAVANNSN
ncbi:hypothetical protein D3C78_980550 [compost metagenome]